MLSDSDVPKGNRFNGGGGDDGTDSAANLFTAEMFFHQSVETAPVDSKSSSIITTLSNRGGWGNNNVFQVDFSIDVHVVDENSTNLPFKNQGVYSPDSDLPTSVPVPASGSAGFESGNGQSCDGGDCHYIAVDNQKRKLYEVYIADVVGGFFEAWGSVAIWDLNKQYRDGLRGDVCTSADAGGFPIAPMLFTAEEVAAGEINHAIRFILPNHRIQCRSYVRPASHGTGSSTCSGWATTNGVPYGARFRLKPSFNVEGLPTQGAKVVARAMQKYGMILADGGNIALTAKSDKSSATKWSGLMGPHDLQALSVNDFEMIEAGTRYNFSNFDCTRNP